MGCRNQYSRFSVAATAQALRATQRELKTIGIVDVPARLPIELPGVGILLQAMVPERPSGVRQLLGVVAYAIGIVGISGFESARIYSGSIDSIVQPKISYSGTLTSVPLPP